MNIQKDNTASEYAFEGKATTQIIDLTSPTPAKTSRADRLDGAALEKAISSARLDRLRATLSAICRRSLEAERIACRLLVADPPRLRKRKRSDADVAWEDNDIEDCQNESLDEEEEAEDVASDEDDCRDESSSSENSGGISIATGRLMTSKQRPKYAKCDRCKQEFDVTKNKKRRCRWHHGSLEADYDWFKDWDDRVHGDIDTPENRMQYSEGFVYDCCDENATSEGSQLTCHVDGLDPENRRGY